MYGDVHTYSRRGLHGQIAHEIAVRIMRGDYPPGDLLPNEDTLSQSLSISRTALREAKKVLAAKGLVDARPKLGTRVRPRHHWNMLDPDILAWQVATTPVTRFVRDLFELRRIIEPEAAAIAAGRATSGDKKALRAAYEDMAAADGINAVLEPDIRFHQTILRATHNELLAPLGSVIAIALETSIKLSSLRPGAWNAALPAHLKILELIETGKDKAANRAMLTLLSGTMADIDDVLADADADMPVALAIGQPSHAGADNG